MNSSVKNNFPQFLFLLYFQNCKLVIFCSTSFFTHLSRAFHFYSFWVKNLLMLISPISRSSNCAFRSGSIFVAVLKGFPIKCLKTKHSYFVKDLFFCLILAGFWRVRYFNCFLFLLIVLSERIRVSNCTIFEINIPFRLEWRITDPSASFSNLVDQVYLVQFYVCIRLTPPSQSAG